MNSIRLRLIAAGAASLLLLTACGSGGGDAGSGDEGAGGGAEGEECVEDFEEGVDYFPDKVEATHSDLWSAGYRDSYVVLSVPNSEFEDQGDLNYVLVRCGAPEPDLSDELADAQTFEVPVQRTVLNHGNGLGMLAEIDAVDTIVGFGDYILSVSDDPWVEDLVTRAADDVNVGEGDDVDFETTLGLEPDVVFLGGFGPGFTNVSDTVDRDLPAVMISNRIESTPLGSSEWMKFMSVFHGAEAEANDRFEEMESRYDEVAEKVGEVLDDDYDLAYFCIDPDHGCDFMSAHGPNSLNGHIIDSLGATNPFAEGNDAANGMGFDYERSLDRAIDADFFVVYDRLSIVEEILDSDSRYDEFPAFTDGDYIAMIDENYSRCRFTSSVEADELMTDYALGMAPDLFPDEEPDCFGPPA